MTCSAARASSSISITTERRLGNKEKKTTYTTLWESIGESGLRGGNCGGGADENDRDLHGSDVELESRVGPTEIFGKNFCGQMDDQKIWCKKMRASGRLRMCWKYEYHC